MNRDRLSAFTDGVVAILITIMVLDLRSPDGPSWHDLFKNYYDFIAYFTSFFIVAIYWNNHHHLFHLLKRVSGKILWANMILLFVMSFVPFTTSWVAQYAGSQAPELLYTVNNLAVDVAFVALSAAILKTNDVKLFETQWGRKTLFSMLVLVVGVLLILFTSFHQIGLIMTLLSMIPWIIPDKQIENHVNNN